MTDNWYYLSLLALLFMGIQRFFYKVSAERGCNTAWTTFGFMGTVTLLSASMLLFSNETINGFPFLFFISVVNSVAFLGGTIAHIEALKYVRAGIVYPVIRLNAVLVVIFSIFYFDDKLTNPQMVGIAAAVAAIIILTGKEDGLYISGKNVKKGFVLIFISLLFGSVASISCKFAAIYSHKLAFMVISYFMGTVLSFGIRKKLIGSNEGSQNRQAVIIGILMGLTNFIGFYAFLMALEVGPLSIIVPVVGLHFIVPIFLSRLIYKETFTPRVIFGVSLALLSFIFLRI